MDCIMTINQNPPKEIKQNISGFQNVEFLLGLHHI